MPEGGERHDVGEKVAGSAMTSKLNRASFASVVAAIAVTALTQSAAAQLSSAQQSAMRSNCRSDFMAKCSGVTPGGKEALECLQHNVATLSPACKSVVSTTMAAPAAPAAAPVPVAAAATHPPTAAQQNAMKKSCRSDFMAHCSGVAPGGKDALACLQRNVGVLSASCKKVVASTMPGAAAHTAARPPAAVPARAAAAPAPAAPTAAQQNAMKQACRSDFMSKCSGVAPGGKDALACLQRNVAGLSPSCKQVVASTMPGGAPPAAQPAAAVETEAAPSGGGFVPGAGIILKACARDLLMHCRGIAGNGKAVACLREREASGHRLGIRCGIALKMQSKLQH